VHGIVRRTCRLERSLIAHLYSDPAVYNQRLFLHPSELDDPTTLRRAFAKAAPDEIYHLAGQSHVGLSFEIPEETCQLTAMVTLRLLEMVRDMNPAPRFFHASSSEIFGEPTQVPQDEFTPVAPVNPYGCARVFATQMVAFNRRTHGCLPATDFVHHESPRRAKTLSRARSAGRRGDQPRLAKGVGSRRREG